jgi:hypothetical protein
MAYGRDFVQNAYEPIMVAVGVFLRPYQALFSEVGAPHSFRRYEHFVPFVIAAVMHFCSYICLCYTGLKLIRTREIMGQRS